MLWFSSIPIPTAYLTWVFFSAHQLNWYRFVGRVLGKALYEGILVEVAFASFFLGKVRLILDLLASLLV